MDVGGVAAEVWLTAGGGLAAAAACVRAGVRYLRECRPADPLLLGGLAAAGLGCLAVGLRASHLIGVGLGAW
jgi:hypothetical protein